MRCINVINFIRGVEPRGPVDLLEPVRQQMEQTLSHKLPATWLLQYDALVSGHFVELLKSRMAANHEVGTWFEMNRLHCDAAGVQWRGRDGYEWDSQPSVAFSIGYTEEERRKLADEAMRRFKKVWGRYPGSVASWNLDSITIAYLSETYGVDAFAVCRDQIATDGFTIWGAPIAGYYPSKLNCWSPALSPANQISTPVFRMLGQDPVYYYNEHYPLPDGSLVHQPDTMEPVWTSGRSPRFIEKFLQMIGDTDCLSFAYAQLGQENNFGWPDMAQAFPMQMEALATLRDKGVVHVETMGESGRRFKKAFRSTPPQAQIMMEDPFGNTKPAETTVWYQSRFYRANLHFKGDVPFIRDLTIYSDRFEQPFLHTATRDHDVDQRLPAVLDGYHWATHPGALDKPGAGGFFTMDGGPLTLAAKPRIEETRDGLSAELPVQLGYTIMVQLQERQLSVDVRPSGALELTFQWDQARGPKVEVRADEVAYEWNGFHYAVKVRRGKATATSSGWTVVADAGRIVLELSQPA